MEEHEYILSLQGQQAVNAGYRFQGEHCYRGIYDHGKRIAQLEVVLDSEEIHRVKRNRQQRRNLF